MRREREIRSRQSEELDSPLNDSILEELWEDVEVPVQQTRRPLCVRAAQAMSSVHLLNLDNSTVLALVGHLMRPFDFFDLFSPVFCCSINHTSL